MPGGFHRLEDKADPSSRGKSHGTSDDAELPAKAGDVNIDHVGARIEMVVPHAVVQLASGDDFACVHHEVFEKLELDGGEIQLSRLRQLKKLH